MYVCMYVCMYVGMYVCMYVGLVWFGLVRSGQVWLGYVM